MDFDVEVIEHETDDAWLLELETGDSVWLPKSQCELDTENMVVTVPEWLAEKKELV